MRDYVNAHKLGLVGGLFVAIMHLVWVLMGLAGIAQGFLNWISGLHMISNSLTVSAFSWGTAIWSLVVAFIAGYILGWVLAWVYNLVLQGRGKGK